MPASVSRKRQGIASAVCGAAALLLIVFAHWEPRADFDVTGILWLMQNILPLSVVGILFVVASGALAQLLLSRLREK
jgi:hypothetical protein